MLGEHLGVDRCGYAEVDMVKQQFIVLGEYVRGATVEITGRYPLAEFDDNERRILTQNEIAIINDIDAEASPGADLTVYRRGEIRAMVCIPLNKAGQMMARMAVHQKTPRHWSNEEVRLISAVANHCWESVERFRATRSLKESEQRYRAFIANSSEAIWRFELERPIPATLEEDEQIEMLFEYAYLAECNNAMARMYGYEHAEQIVGVRLRNLLDKAAPTNIDFFRALRASGYRLNDVETKEVDRFGNTKYFLNNLSAILENGAIVRGWGTQREITEQRRAEEERERLLQQEKAAREQAEAANRMKEEFLALISHELRTPLTSILGWVQMLRGGSLTEGQTRHALEVIEQNAKREARLVNDILDTSRLVAGELKLETGPVDIREVFLAAVDVLRSAAEKKNIQLKLDIDDCTSIVLGDHNRLHQVVWNVLSNAIKFTSEHGSVDGKLECASDHIEISVKDTGIGIAAPFLPYIFDRFRLADGTSTRRYGGVGLGLAIVRHVVEMHGGTVSASSEGPGRGATFTLRFPTARGGSPTQPALQPGSDDRKLAGLRVMVVEDDPDTLSMLQLVLDKFGAVIMTATSTTEALDILDRWTPDALISDLAMPDRDGYELIAQLRTREKKRGGRIPAVAFSAYARSEDHKRSLEAGFDVHIPKPINPAELADIVAGLALLHRAS